MSQDSSAEILFASDPPLRRKIATSLKLAIEKSLNSALTDAQASLFESQLIEEWQRGDEARKAVEQAAALFDQMVLQIGALPKPKQALAWQEFGRQIYVYAREQGSKDPVGRLIIDTYESKNTLLVSTPPPLSKQAAESYAEMTAFFHSVLNRTSSWLAPDKKEQIVKELAADFESYAPEIKEQISQADSLWGVVRYNWQQASRDERERFRQDLIRSIRGTGSSAEESRDSAEPKSEEKAEEPKGESISSLAKNNNFMAALKNLRSATSGAKSSLFQSSRPKK